MLNKPNIIFILSDQQRWDTMGCYGQKLDITPNLDKMAEKGILFKNAFTCQPVCGPARSCLQTGKYATETGCYRNNIALPQDEKTIAHWMSEAGYKVGYIGKWHLASTGEESAEKIGPQVNYQTRAIPLEFRGGWKDYWLASDLLEFTSHGYDGHLFDGDMNKVEFKGYRVDALTDFVLNYLDNRDKDKPFFLFTSYIEPHHQNDHNRYEGPQGSKERFKDYEIPGDLIDTQGDWNKHYPDYLGCCNSLDFNVGRIIDRLEKLGIADDTIIIYTSDHGSHFRTRNLNITSGYDDYKRSCHEATIHIPMIFYGPGFKQGKNINELVSLIDIPKTIMTIAGLNPPEHMRGRPLQEVIDHTPEDWPQEVFLQISESQVGRAIRTERWKYSVKAPDKDGRIYASSDLYQEDFLYDLENDPYEKNNLINNPDYSDIRKDLRTLLLKHIKEIENKTPEISCY